MSVSVQVARIGGIVAAIAMILSFVILGLRNDGEIIVFPDGASADNMTSASMDLPHGSSYSLFVCAPEAQQEQLAALENIIVNSLGANGNAVISDALQLTIPMPLDLPEEFAQAYHLPNLVYCSETDIVNPEDESEIVMLPAEAESGLKEIELPGGMFAVAAVSEGGLPWRECSLFLIFFWALWGTFAVLAKSVRFSYIRFKRYDFLLAFAGGNVLSYGLLMLIDLIPLGMRQELLPQYSEMLVMLVASFVGFLATAIFFVWLRKEKQVPLLKPVGALCANDEMDESGKVITSQGDEKASILTGFATVPVKLRYPLGLGIGLALVGAVVVSMLIEQPGLTTLTMASQLVSTLYLTGIFAILAAVSEESIFRGVIQSSLEARPGAKNPMLTNAIAIGVASILFVAMHVAQSIDHLWALVPIAAVSVTSGILKIRFRTIFPCILLHMTYNATLVIPGILFGL